MADKMEDKREELGSKFQELLRQYFDPVAYPHVRWRDVEDARVDVALHTSQLLREQVIKREDIEARQKQSPEQPVNRIPV